MRSGDRSKLKSIKTGSAGAGRGNMPSGRPANVLLNLLPRDCSPRDIAGFLVEFITEHEQRREVAELLLKELPRAVRVKELITL